MVCVRALKRVCSIARINPDSRRLWSRGSHGVKWILTSPFVHARSRLHLPAAASIRAHVQFKEWKVGWFIIQHSPFIFKVFCIQYCQKHQQYDILKSSFSISFIQFRNIEGRYRFETEFVQVFSLVFKNISQWRRKLVSISTSPLSQWAQIVFLSVIYTFIYKLI